MDPSPSAHVAAGGLPDQRAAHRGERRPWVKPGPRGAIAASRLTNGKASNGQVGTQSLGCAGQTVRPSLHSTSQTSAGKLSVLSYSVSVLMFDVRGIM